MKLCYLLLIACLFVLPPKVNAQKKRENKCENAVQEHTDFQSKGVYGSPLESEWHPAAAYVLIKEMQRFKVLKKEFVEKKSVWRFEFVEMIGGKSIVFVYHLEKQVSFCDGPNAFFVVKK